jgi:hypothetical protein
VFSQLKACQPAGPRKGTFARAARPLGFAAVAVAAAVTVAGCKPGSITSASPTGVPHSRATTSGPTSTGPPMSALSLAAQQSQQIRSFTASLAIQASGALTATLTGTLKEVTTPSPLISVRAHAGALGSIRLILANDMVYLKSPLLAGMYHKPWVGGPATAMSNMSGLSLGPLPGLLQTSSPSVQLPLLSQGLHVRQMGSMGAMGAMGSGLTEFGGHYRLSSALHSLSAGLQPSMRSVMDSGVSMTRFRVWMDRGHMVRKLVLIAAGQHTRIVITLVITSVNRPVRIQLPRPALIFILGSATPAPSMTPTMMPSAQPTTTVMPTATPTPASTVPGMAGTPTPVPSSAPTHW